MYAAVYLLVSQAMPTLESGIGRLCSIAHCRKRSLQAAETRWALEPVDHVGKLADFSSQYIGMPQDTLGAFGVCMDLNPYQLTAPWTNFEFATDVVSSKATLIILSIAIF